MRWTYKPLPADEVGALARATGGSAVLAELLLRNGLGDPVVAAKFLKPALAELNDPFLLPNVETAAMRLRGAIESREQVIVLGDYDVDGVSSTTLLVSVLRRFGLHPHFVVPRRMEDGYGLSRSAIDRALERGKPDLHRARLRHQLPRRSRLSDFARHRRARHRPSPVQGKSPDAGHPH